MNPTLCAVQIQLFDQMFSLGDARHGRSTGNNMFCNKLTSFNQEAKAIGLFL